VGKLLYPHLHFFVPGGAIWCYCVFVPDKAGLRSMAKKVVKQPPHLRIRIDPKLIARLEKARGTSGNTLTGEIVTRLEESFSTQDKIALIKESQESRDRHYERLVEERERLLEAAAQFQHEADVVGAYVAMIDALMGDDMAAKEAVRSVAVLLAANPGWASNSDSVHKVTQAAIAAIKAAAEKGVQK
jgi:hypothetical protein